MAESGKNLPLLITGVGGGGVGSQLLKTLRLSTLDYQIVGTDVSPKSKGLMEVDKPYLLPRATDEAYIETLLRICQREGVKAVFPGSEPELLKLSEHREVIADAGIFMPIQPRSVLEVCSDKDATMKFLAAQGFAVPKSVMVSQAADLEKVDFYPAVLKPSTGAGGSAGVMIAQSPQELQALGSYMLNDYEGFLAQEYVGDIHSEYTIGVLTSMDAELINSVAIKRIINAGLGNRIRVKNRTNRKELGAILAISSGLSQGELGRYEEVTKPAERIALALGATSAINVQCRLVMGEIYVFEINPRYSGTTYMRAMMGYNEPDVMIRKHLLNESIKPGFDYKEGLILRGLHERIIEEDKVIDIRKES